SASDGRSFHPRFLGLLDFRRWLFRFSFLFCLWWRGLFLLLLFRCRRFFSWLLRLLWFLCLLFFFFGFWLFLFFFLLFFLLLFFVWFLVFAPDEGNPIAHVDLAALLDINLGEGSVLGRFPFHRRFVGLNLSENFTGRDLVALLFFPRDESALGHGVAQFGHLNFRHGMKVKKLKSYRLHGLKYPMLRAASFK